MKGKVLLLNQHGLPLNILKMNKAINKWMKGKVEILETVDDSYFTYEGKEQQFPTVMIMKYFVNVTKKRNLKDFYTKANVWKRDKGVCQYCGKTVTLQEFTVDHVVPKKKGGKGEWTNVVTSCFKCNNKKDCKSLDESGFKLLNKPRIPNIPETIEQTMLYRFKNLTCIPYTSWEKYLN